MRLMIGWVVSLVWLATAQAFEPVSFRYESPLGEWVCSYKLEGQVSSDWLVTCVTPFGEKRFGVHLLVRVHPRSQGEQLEILYWVADRTNLYQSYHSGASSWIRLDQKGELSELTLNQSVEGDYARLWVNVRRPKTKAPGPIKLPDRRLNISEQPG